MSLSPYKGTGLTTECHLLLCGNNKYSLKMKCDDGNLRHFSNVFSLTDTKFTLSKKKHQIPLACLFLFQFRHIDLKKIANLPYCWASYLNLQYVVVKHTLIHSLTIMNVWIFKASTTPLSALAWKGEKKLQMKLFRESINLFNSIKYQVQLKHFPFRY